MPAYTFSYASSDGFDLDDIARLNKEAMETKKSEQNANNYMEVEDKLTVKEQESRYLRMEGLGHQESGNLDEAMNAFQKAIELDPTYAAVYNDLGIIYEAKSQFDRAELSYIKAIKNDPYLLGAYSNLALLYEAKRELFKASQCWKKRISLDNTDNPWKDKAIKHLEDIQLVLGEKDIEEQQARQEIAKEKMTSVLMPDSQALAQRYFGKAKELYAQGKETAALKEAINAKSLDPTNSEIEDFINKLQLKLLAN